ncbi:tetratricopeptide repeat protein [Devosia ginsengisoli]|uniref:tetratricopeptide repeat protein n=1 Tax=Devosia ginsengisoli TaxID=400770 RepID=UPI0026EA08E0|nr:tetratricopeptide repeat protein [Devosia ginsengisoli]MCR6671429.1 tetratricopeptide repeat protein [Devosia ginsengisoli]
MRASGESYGVIGALQAFPLRLATRRVQGLGGRLHRNITRGTTAVVLGRTLLARKDEIEIERRVAEARDKQVPLLSENGFLRLLRSLPPVPTANITRQAMLDQSRLDGEVLDLLALFDAFEHHVEPFSFRDVILAKKYAGLVASGASWSAIARSVHRIGPVGSLTALTLQADGPARIVARDAHSLAELDGQRLLPLPEVDEDAEDYFGLAETAEAAELFAEAATLYEHCSSIDPTDAVAAFNFGNCLRKLGNLGEAATAYITAIKRDPDFVEAWFNHGGVLRDMGRVAAAREHLARAVALDPDYADAVYNLAALEYDAHDLAAARQWWLRYLELDSDSDWARRARAGVGLANRTLNKAG